MSDQPAEHLPRDVVVVRLPELLRLTGLGRATIYRGIQSGQFPAPIKLGARAVGWKTSTVLAWLDARPSARAADMREAA